MHPRMGDDPRDTSSLDEQAPRQPECVLPAIADRVEDDNPLQKLRLRVGEKNAALLAARQEASHAAAMEQETTGGQRAIASKGSGTPSPAGLGRNKSAERRGTSRRFHNHENWECQQYRVKVSTFLDGRRILDVSGVNDLALVGSVVGMVSEALVICPSRVGLVFEGKRILRPDSMSLYQLGEFRRCLEFEVVVLPPRRCNICQYDLRTTGAMPAGRFIRGGELLDYHFSQGGTDDLTNEDDASSESWPANDDWFGAGEVRDAAWRAQESCYCDLVASEFGWKLVRTWSRLMRNLRRQRRAQLAKRGSEITVSPTLALGDELHADGSLEEECFDHPVPAGFCIRPRSSGIAEERGPASSCGPEEPAGKQLYSSNRAVPPLPSNPRGCAAGSDDDTSTMLTDHDVTPACLGLGAVRP